MPYDNIAQCKNYHNLYLKFYSVPERRSVMEKPVVISYKGQNMIGMLHESDNVKLNKWVIMIHGIK